MRKPAFMKKPLGRLFLRLHFKDPSARPRHPEPGPGTIGSPFVFTAILVFERRASFPTIKRCEIPARKVQFISGEESEPANQWGEQFSNLDIATSLSANNFKRCVSKFSIISNVVKRLIFHCRRKIWPAVRCTHLPSGRFTTETNLIRGRLASAPFVPNRSEWA